MAQTVNLWGATYSDVPAILVPSGNGVARFTDATVTTAEEADVASGKVFIKADGSQAIGTASGGGGGGLVLVKEFEPMAFTFAETAFNGWTPSSTAKAILATQTVGTFTAADMAENDYFIRTKCCANVQYIEGTSTAKGMTDFCVMDNWYSYTRRPSTYAMMNAGTRNTNVFETMSNVWVLKYYNTAWTLIYSGSYSIYPSNSAPSSSSTTATSPTVTVKTPVINAKCNATYFSTAMAGKVDQDASTITFKSYAYRVDGGYTRQEPYESLIDMWHNGL